jgi:hypothetical protein
LTSKLPSIINGIILWDFNGIIMGQSWDKNGL